MTSEPVSRPRNAISFDLARALHDAGLAWHPAQGDRFHIPDRDLDHLTFAISDMVVELRDSIGGLGRELAFNGTVEWALDSIMKADVVWLPTEAQLREELGDDFIALHPDEGAIACVAHVDGSPRTFVAPTAVEAYGRALLAVLTVD